MDIERRWGEVPKSCVIYESKVSVHEMGKTYDYSVTGRPRLDRYDRLVMVTNITLRVDPVDDPIHLHPSAV